LREIPLRLFSKCANSHGESTKCPYHQIEWIDHNNNVRSVDCFDQNNRYKGLLLILNEIGLLDINPISAKLSVGTMKELLKRCPAFEDNTHLEKVANQYGVKIIWAPKFHCELNPIEGFWCDLKWYVRKYNDQN
jgi:hypothetical protein